MRCICEWVKDSSGNPIIGAQAASLCPVHSLSVDKRHVAEGLRQFDAAAFSGEPIRDDRHTFSSGASSSGKLPPYHTVPAYFFDRVANVRGFGDKKYGVDNWKKGAQDREFILDRISHGIQHFMKLAEKVKEGRVGPTDTIPGQDDAAACAVNALFVMEWQRQQQKKMEALSSGEWTTMKSREQTVHVGAENQASCAPKRHAVDGVHEKFVMPHAVKAGETFWLEVVSAGVRVLPKDEEPN